MMFHVKHPQFTHKVSARKTALTGLIAASALFAAACTRSVTPAKGWAPPVPGPNGVLLVQSGPGRLTTTKPDGSRLADYQIEGITTSTFFGLRQTQAAPSPLYAAPLVAGNAVYLVAYDGRVVRLNLDGNNLGQQWVTDLGEQVVATPVLRGDRLYISTEHGRLEVLNTANGTRITSNRPTEGRVWGAPALQETRIFIGTLDSSELLAVNADTGNVEWKQKGVGAAAGDLVLEGDLLVVPSFDRTIHALATTDGVERWRFAGDGWFVGRPLVTKDTIYAGSMRGSVYALDRAGKMLWRFQRAPLEFRAAPILAGDTVIAAGRDGTIVGLDAKTGAEKWTRSADSAVIEANGVLVDGAVYYSTDDHRLLRLDPAKGDIQTFNVQPPKGNGK
ncbi:MAG: PQQ-binding-like beta-propeller repeat protein [Chloroflexota bacterium]